MVMSRQILDSCHECGTMRMPPLAHEPQERLERPSHIGKRIFDLRRNLAKHLAMNQPVTFEFPQVQGQHPLRRCRQVFAKRSEPLVTLEKTKKDRQLPMPFDYRQRGLNAARQRGALSGYSQ